MTLSYYGMHGHPHQGYIKHLVSLNLKYFTYSFHLHQYSFYFQPRFLPIPSVSLPYLFRIGTVSHPSLIGTKWIRVRGVSKVLNIRKRPVKVLKDNRKCCTGYGNVSPLPTQLYISAHNWKWPLVLLYTLV